MKYATLGLLLVIAGFVVVGCDHSTNNTPAPKSTGLAITNPIHESFVEGTVNIEVSTKGVSTKYVEFYINGTLYSTRSAAPWQVAWNTSELPTNSSYTIKAISYSESNAYTASKDIIVTKK